MKLALVTIYNSETDTVVTELNQTIVNTRLMLKTLDECLTEEDNFLDEQIKRLEISYEETKQRLEHIKTEQENREKLASMFFRYLFVLLLTFLPTFLRSKFKKKFKRE